MLEAEERAEGPSRDQNLAEAAFYEVTIASADQPKLLSRLSEALVSDDACARRPQSTQPAVAPASFCPVSRLALPHHACEPLTCLVHPIDYLLLACFPAERAPLSRRAT